MFLDEFDKNYSFIIFYASKEMFNSKGARWILVGNLLFSNEHIYGPFVSLQYYYIISTQMFIDFGLNMHFWYFRL